MFRRELELARDRAGLMLSELDQALTAAASEDTVELAERALDHGWRMESALGQFLAIDDVKARAMALVESKERAKRAFDLVRDGLTGADDARCGSAAELKEYLIRLKALVVGAYDLLEDALSEAAEEETWRYRGEEDLSAPPLNARARVVIVRDPQYARSFDGVRHLVATALEPLGGMRAFVKPGNTVLIKPNLTLFFLAEEGVSTDPRVVAALVSLARDAGAARVIVGESSGGGTRTTEAMEITGIASAARREGAELVDFHTCEQREVDVTGKIIDRILLPAPLLDADVVINVPKAKTHHLDFISCAIKNWVGVLRPDVRELHHDWNTYQEYVDIIDAVLPALNVVDAIYIGEGDGPGANTGRFYGGIVASTDPVATDATVARLLGFDPAQVAFIQVAKESGLGVADAREIEVVGVPLEEARIEAKAPRIGLDYLDAYANVIVGAGVSRPGTLGHFKSSADIWDKMSIWKAIVRLKGKPTIMIGDAEDPLFERHLREGPYIVIDDAARPKYKRHPDVTFIPGHPALHNILPQLMDGLKVAPFGDATFRLMKLLRNAESYLQYSRTPAKPLAAATATMRDLPIVAQYGTLGLLAAGLALGLVWAVAGILGGLRKK